MPNHSKANKKKQPHRSDTAAAARALQALALRQHGLTYEQIAQQCGYRSKSGAYDAVQRELQRTMQEPADNVRTLEVRRLDALYEVMEAKALKGDKDSTWYVDRCLSIMDRRAKLLGLDAKPDAGLGAQMTLVAVEAAVLEAI